MIITITGKSGSGKSTIAEYLTALDNKFLHVNIDLVGHLVLEDNEVIKQVAEEFNIPLNKDFKIDRNVLGSIVFNDCKKMDRYADITWSKMENIIDQVIKSNEDKIIILDWILIPKTKYFLQSDINILVFSEKEIRLLRAQKRDSINRAKFEEREQTSIDYSNLDFDFIIENRSIEKTKEMVKKIYDKGIISR